MKRLILIAALTLAPAIQGEIIDRIMAAVNQKIITLSDVRRERLIRALLGDKAPQEDIALVKELVDSEIIDEQIEQFPGISVSSDQVAEQAAKFPELHGVPPAAVRTAIRRRMMTAEFVELRFRQFIRASDEEIQKYYDTQFVPAAQKRGLDPVPPLSAVTDEIRKNVVEDKTIHEIDTWLEALRRRSDVEIFN